MKGHSRSREADGRVDEPLNFGWRKPFSPGGDIVQDAADQAIKRELDRSVGRLRCEDRHRLAAFKRCICLGIGMVETNVQLTKDGVPVLTHDTTVDRTTSGCACAWVMAAPTRLSLTKRSPRSRKRCNWGGLLDAGATVFLTDRPESLAVQLAGKGRRPFNELSSVDPPTKPTLGPPQPILET